MKLEDFWLKGASGMTGIRRFEDLVAWQKARALTVDVYLATRREPFVGDYSLARQIQRAAVSVMSNVAEGFYRGGNREFYQFLSVAGASCAEVRSQLYVALDVGYITQSEFGRLMMKADEVGRVIAGLRSSVKAHR